MVSGCWIGGTGCDDGHILACVDTADAVVRWHSYHKGIESIHPPIVQCLSAHELCVHWNLTRLPRIAIFTWPVRQDILKGSLNPIKFCEKLRGRFSYNLNVGYFIKRSLINILSTENLHQLWARQFERPFVVLI